MCSPQLSQERKTILIREYNDACKDLKCTICLSLYTNPVTLTKCKHTYCLECYKQLFTSRNTPKALLCPICKAPASRRGYFVDKALQEKVEYLQIQRSIVASWDEDNESTGAMTTVSEVKTPKRMRRLSKVSVVSTDGSTSSSGNGVKHASGVKYRRGVKNTTSLSGVSDANNTDVLSSAKSANFTKVTSGVKRTGAKNIKYISDTNSALYTANASSAIQKNKSGVSTKRNINNVNYTSDSNSTSSSVLFTSACSSKRLLELTPPSRRHLVRKTRSLNIVVTKRKSTNRKYRHSMNSVNFDTENCVNIDEFNSNTLDESDDKIIDLIEDDCLDCIENEVNIIEQENNEKLRLESSFTSKTEMETGWARLKHMKHNIKKKNAKQFKKLNVSAELPKKSTKSSKLSEKNDFDAFSSLNANKTQGFIDNSGNDSHVVSLADFEAYLSKNIDISTTLLNRSEIDQIKQPELRTNQNKQSEIDQINRQIAFDLNRPDKEINNQQTQPDIQLNPSNIEIKMEKDDTFNINRQIISDEDDIYSVCTQKLHFSPPKMQSFSIKERRYYGDIKSKTQHNLSNINSLLNNKNNSVTEENLNEIRLYSPELDTVKSKPRIDNNLNLPSPDIQLHKSFEGEIIQNQIIRITPDSIYNEITENSDWKSPSSSPANKSTSKPNTVDDFEFISGSETSNLRLCNLRTYIRKPRLAKNHKSVEKSTKVHTKRKLSATDSNSQKSDVDLFDSLKSSKSHSTIESIVINDTNESKLSSKSNSYERKRKSRRLNKEINSDNSLINSQKSNITINSLDKIGSNREIDDNYYDIIEIDLNNPASNQCVSQKSEIIAELNQINEKRAEMLETFEINLKHNNNLLSQLSNYLSNSQSPLQNPITENYRSLPLFPNTTENSPFFYNTVAPYLENIRNYYDKIKDVTQQNNLDVLELSYKLRTKSIEIGISDSSNCSNNANKCSKRDTEVQTEPLKCPKCTYNFIDTVNNNCEMSNLENDSNLSKGPQNETINQNLEELNAQKGVFMPLIVENNLIPVEINKNVEVLNAQNDELMPLIEQGQIMPELAQNLETSSLKIHQNDLVNANTTEQLSQIDVLRCGSQNGSQYSTDTSEIGVRKRVNRQLQFSGSESGEKRKFKRIVTPSSDSESLAEISTKRLKYNSKLLYQDDIDVIFDSEMSGGTPKSHTQNDLEFMKKLMNKTDEEELKKIVAQAQKPKENTQDVTARYISMLEKEYKDVQFHEEAQIPQNCQFLQNAQNAQTHQIAQSAKPQTTPAKNAQTLPSTQYLLQTPKINLAERLKICQIAQTPRPARNSIDFSLKNSCLDNLLADVNVSFETKNSEKLSMSLFTESYNLRQKKQNFEATKLGNSSNVELMSASLFSNTEIRQNSITNLDIILASNKALNDVEDEELDKEVANLTCADDSLQSEHDIFGDDLIVESTPQKLHKTNPILNSRAENTNLEWLNIAPPPQFQDIDTDLSKTPDFINKIENNPITNTDNIFPSTPQKPSSTRKSAQKYINPVALAQKEHSLKHPEPTPNQDTENIVDATPQKPPNQNLSYAKPRKSAHKYLNPIALAQKDKFTPLNIVVSTPAQKPQICVTPRQKSILNYLTPQPLKIAQNRPETNELLGICRNFFTNQNNSAQIDTNLVQNKENLSRISDIVAGIQSNTDTSTKTFDFEDKRIGLVNSAQTIEPNKASVSEIKDNAQTKLVSTTKILQNAQKPNAQMPQNAQILQDISNKVETNRISCVTPISPNLKPVCIASTRLKKEETLAIFSLTTKLKAKYSRDFSPNVTHLVVSVDERNRLTDHTIKYILAISHSLWIVSFRWISDSLAHNQLLPEEMYEALDVSGCCGPKLSRLSRKSHPLFRNYVIHCADPFVSVNRTDLEDAIRSLGGEIRRSATDLNKENRNEKICLILSEAKITQDYDQYQMWRETLNILVLDIEWLSRSVGQYQVANVRPFVLCLEDGMDKLGYPFALVAPTPDTLSYTLSTNTH